MSKSQESKQKICEAAVIVAARDGFSALSLDAVAREAGVSKSGLLYHYSSKDELIEATLNYFAKSWRQMLFEKIAVDPAPKMRWARGLITCMFPSEEENKASKHDCDPSILPGFMLSMLAMAADRNSNMTPIRELGAELRDQLIEDDGAGLEQLMLWLAMDGLLIWQLLGLIDKSDPLFEEVGNAFRERVGLPPLKEQE